MPTSRREDTFIELFLSAYEHGSWAEGEHSQPDKVDRTKPAVDWFVKRKSDGKTLAIEHTIVEPFVGDKADFVAFEAAFLRIERDASLLVPGQWIQVFVPVGILKNQNKKVAQDAIVESVHSWIKSNRLTLPAGTSQHRCRIIDVPGKETFDIPVNVKVVPLKHGSAAKSGSLQVRRQQMNDDLDQVVQKTLMRKVGKLVNSGADKSILLLERQHMNLFPERILQEINKQRAAVPDLARVDEIWIVETMLYETSFGGTYVRFEFYENGTQVSSFDFDDGKLLTRYERGIATMN